MPEIISFFDLLDKHIASGGSLNVTTSLSEVKSLCDAIENMSSKELGKALIWLSDSHIWLPDNRISVARFLARNHPQLFCDIIEWLAFADRPALLVSFSMDYNQPIVYDIATRHPSYFHLLINKIDEQNLGTVLTKKASFKSKPGVAHVFQDDDSVLLQCSDLCSKLLYGLNFSQYKQLLNSDLSPGSQLFFWHGYTSLSDVSCAAIDTQEKNALAAARKKAWLDPASIRRYFSTWEMLTCSIYTDHELIKDILKCWPQFCENIKKILVKENTAYPFEYLNLVKKIKFNPSVLEWDDDILSGLCQVQPNIFRRLIYRTKPDEYKELLGLRKELERKTWISVIALYSKSWQKWKDYRHNDTRVSNKCKLSKDALNHLKLTELYDLYEYAVVNTPKLRNFILQRLSSAKRTKFLTTVGDDKQRTLLCLIASTEPKDVLQLIAKLDDKDLIKCLTQKTVRNRSETDFSLLMLLKDSRPVFNQLLQRVSREQFKELQSLSVKFSRKLVDRQGERKFSNKECIELDALFSEEFQRLLSCKNLDHQGISASLNETSEVKIAEFFYKKETALPYFDSSAVNAILNRLQSLDCRNRLEIRYKVLASSVEGKPLIFWIISRYPATCIEFMNLVPQDRWKEWTKYAWDLAEDNINYLFDFLDLLLPIYPNVLTDKLRGLTLSATIARYHPMLLIYFLKRYPTAAAKMASHMLASFGKLEVLLRMAREDQKLLSLESITSPLSVDEDCKLYDMRGNGCDVNDGMTFEDELYDDGASDDELDPQSIFGETVLHRLAFRDPLALSALLNEYRDNERWKQSFIISALYFKCENLGHATFKQYEAFLEGNATGDKTIVEPDGKLTIMDILFSNNAKGNKGWYQALIQLLELYHEEVGSIPDYLCKPPGLFSQIEARLQSEDIVYAAPSGWKALKRWVKEFREKEQDKYQSSRMFHTGSSSESSDDSLDDYGFVF